MKRVNFIIIIVLLIIVSFGSAIIFRNIFSNGIEKNICKDKEIRNIILMIGDGMGENHIIASQILKGDMLVIQIIENKTYVTTESIDGVTDSAAAATAIATGFKTNNMMLGIDANGNEVENVIEFANKNGLKTGIVCTSVLNDATPAGFCVHNRFRYDYDRSAKLEIESCVDLMFGGGREYFSKYENEMKENGFIWVNDFSELSNIDKNSKIIGTFAESEIYREDVEFRLADMTKEAISRLENENGFFLMVEGSLIDIYSEKKDVENMIKEVIEFDNAIEIAKEYVDEHSDTLLIVTADHETGGLNLDNVTSAEQLTKELFIFGNSEFSLHTNINVPLYIYGNGAEDLTKYDVIDNTDIFKFIRECLS